jgi:DNA-binding NtrC family response regulator
MKRHEQSSGETPVIYAVGEKDLMELLGRILDEHGQSCRTFTDAHALFEVFASARQRPVVLITGCLDRECTGLRLIQKCKEIEPGLKVLLWSGYSEGTLASLLAKVPVIPDARLPKGKEIDLERLLSTIKGLVTGTLQTRPAAS